MISRNTLPWLRGSIDLLSPSVFLTKLTSTDKLQLLLTDSSWSFPGVLQELCDLGSFNTWLLSLWWTEKQGSWSFLSRNNRLLWWVSKPKKKGRGMTKELETEESGKWEQVHTKTGWNWFQTVNTRAACKVMYRASSEKKHRIFWVSSLESWVWFAVCPGLILQAQKVCAVHSYFIFLLCM